MTDTTASGAGMPLGVGNIISESFSILFGNFVKVILLGFVGTFLGYIFNQFVLGFDPNNSTLALTDPGRFWTLFAISMVVSMVVYALVTALLIQLAYDAKLGRSRGMGDYFGPALAAILPIAILSIVVGILTGIGALALVIGALWVYAVFIAMAPAAVIEKAGFGALGRSASLTKGYRWPIVGVLIVVWIVIFLIQMVAGFLLVGMAGMVGSGAFGLIIFGIAASLLGAIGYGLGGISVALIYARLREIKEGIGVDEIAAVFD